MILQQSATFERKSDGAIAIQCSVCFFSGFSTCHCSTNVSSSSSSSSTTTAASSTSSKAGNSSKNSSNQNNAHYPPNSSSKRGQGGSGGSSTSGDRNTSGSSSRSNNQLKKCDDIKLVEDNFSNITSAAANAAGITGKTTSTDKAEVAATSIEVLEELAALRPGNNNINSSYLIFLPPKNDLTDFFLFWTFAVSSLQQQQHKNERCLFDATYLKQVQSGLVICKEIKCC